MTLPAQVPGSAGHVPEGQARQSPGARGSGLPGGRVIAVATLLIVGTAVVEAATQERIGLWTDVVLVVVSVVAALITRAGDRSLPAMMPPLAFLAAALVGGQLLLPDHPNSLRTREALMLLDVLGQNAPWVVGATALTVTISTARHLVDRRRG